jgi:hypothetical protein
MDHHRYARQLSSAAAHYDHQSEPNAEISDEAFQDACLDVALAMDSDDIAELVNIMAELAPALAYIASTNGFANAYNFPLREALCKCESLRRQVVEQAGVMS